MRDQFARGAERSGAEARRPREMCPKHAAIAYAYRVRRFLLSINVAAGPRGLRDGGATNWNRRHYWNIESFLSVRANMAISKRVSKQRQRAAAKYIA